MGLCELVDWGHVKSSAAESRADCGSLLDTPSYRDRPCSLRLRPSLTILSVKISRMASKHAERVNAARLFLQWASRPRTCRAMNNNPGVHGDSHLAVATVLIGDPRPPQNSPHMVGLCLQV